MTTPYPSSSVVLVRPISAIALSLLLCVTLAVPAYATEVETDGFTVRIPPGYRKLLKAELDTSAFNFPMATAFMKGDPEIHVYVKGEPPEPQAAICVIHMALEQDTGRLSDKEFAEAQSMLRGMLGATFKMDKRTFEDSYDAIEIRCRLEDIPTSGGVEGDVRFMLVGCGKYAAFLGLVNYKPDYAADAELEWTNMVGGMKIHPPTDWMFWLMLLLGFSGFFLFIGRVLLKKPPPRRYGSDFGEPFGAPRPSTSGRSSDGMPIFGEEVQRQTVNMHVPRAGNEMPQAAPDGLADPVKQPVERAPLPPRGEGGEDGPGGGLVSTLPPSGRWSDQFGKKGGS